MEAQSYANAIAANAVLEELIDTLRIAKVLNEQQIANLLANAARKLNGSEDQSLKNAAKAVTALYTR